MKRYINASILATILLMAGGCAKDLEMSPDEENVVPSQLTLTLNVPDYTVTDLGTRAETTPFSTLSVYCYDKDGNYLSSSSLTSGWQANGAGRYNITVPIDKKTVSVQLATDVTEEVKDGRLDLTYHSDPDKNVLWGRAEIRDLLSQTGTDKTVTMLRHNAKVSVNNTATGFTVNRIGVYGTATCGSVAPAGLTNEPTIPNVKANEPYHYGEAQGESALKPADAEVNIFETERDKAVGETSYEAFETRSRIIVEGTYGGVKGYYVVGFRERSGSGDYDTPASYHYKAIDVMRNHHYRVNIESVRAAGWPTLAEALKAEPDNRLTVLIIDQNDAVTNIIATKDYELGVSDDIDAGNTATKAVITVVTSYPATDASKRITLSDNADWLKTESVSLPQPAEISVGTGRNFKGYRYTIEIPLEPNTDSKVREGKITVRSGDLTREIKVTQSSFDFMRDPNRKVTMLMDATTVTEDYFGWVDNTLYGTQKSCFYDGKTQRDNGLIFPAVPAYTAKYRIKKQTGDTDVKLTGEGFVINSTNASYYEITCNATTPGIAVGSFSLTNASGINVSYPLYRTGYIHRLTDAHKAYQFETEAVTGWYYYEVVKVGNLWTLDRNIGATDNYPYISTRAAMHGHERAVGGYFKLTTARQTSMTNPTTVLSNMGMSSWRVPTMEDVTAMSVATEDVTPQGAERTIVATVATQSPSKLSKVYLPHGGYYEDDSHQFETHADIWTSTLLSGNQGYSSTSPEFGFWFKYLDVYNSKVSFGNIRFVNGTAGEAPTAESVYKYMPIRPVWK